MKSKITILILIFIIVIYADDFENNLKKLTFYSSTMDTLLVEQYPDSTVKKMLDYLETDDYGKRYIAMRLLKIFNDKESIIDSLKNRNIDIKSVFIIADSLFEDSELESLAINGNSKIIITYISFLKKRFNENDFNKLLVFTTNENESVKVSAINAISYFIEKNNRFTNELPFDTIKSLYEKSSIYGKEKLLELMKYYPKQAMEYADELIEGEYYSTLYAIRIMALFEKYDNQMEDNQGRLNENINIMQNYLKRNKHEK